MKAAEHRAPAGALSTPEAMGRRKAVASYCVDAAAHSTGVPRRANFAAMPPPGLIIVLGSPNDEQGNLHSLAVERCRRALRLHRDNPGWPLLLTGGFGAHFNTTDRPHAFYLRRWLEANAVPPSAFLPFAESRNTLEDASFAKPIVLVTGTRFALIVTSDFHADRARFVFEREFAGTGVTLCFVATETDEAACRLDLAALKRHETAALARLRAAAGPAPKTKG